MRNFLKLLYRTFTRKFFPSFCASCETVLIYEKILCNFCSQSFFALWNLEEAVCVLIKHGSQLDFLIKGKKLNPHKNRVKFTLFLKALLELKISDEMIILDESCSDYLKGLSDYFFCKKFCHDDIYVNQKIIFLIDSPRHMNIYETYFKNSRVHSLKTLCLHD